MVLKSRVLGDGAVHLIKTSLTYRDSWNALKFNWENTDWDAIKFVVYIMEADVKIEMTAEEMVTLINIAKAAGERKVVRHPVAFYCPNRAPLADIEPFMKEAERHGIYNMRRYTSYEEVEKWTGCDMNVAMALFSENGSNGSKSRKQKIDP